MWREDFEDGIFEDEEQGNPREKLCCVGIGCVLGVLGVCWLIFGGVYAVYGLVFWLLLLLL